MSVQVDHLQGVEAADAELTRLMTADGVDAGAIETAETEQTTETEPGKSVQPGQEHAAQATAGTTQETEPKPTDTRSDGATRTGQQKKEDEQGKKVAAEKSAADAKKSRFAKEQERRTRTWEEINAEKAALKVERETFQKQQAEFADLRKKEEDKYSPEAYDQVAEQFEKAGKLEFAEAARERAKQLRADPERANRIKAETAKAETERKEWTTKAGIDYPELVKQDSPLAQGVAQMLKDEPDLRKHPKGIYLAARLANAEAASARVPALVKELEKLRAKVKELEIHTAPDGGGGAAALPGQKSFEQMSDKEQEAVLEREAREMGTFR